MFALLDLLGWKWQLTPVFLPGKFHGQRSLAGYSPWGHTESESHMTEQLRTQDLGHSAVAMAKEYTCNAGDLGLIPGSGRSPGGGHDNPLQYSCLENPMERGAWRATVHGVTKESDSN